MVMKHFDDTLSVFCGGIDNLFRHHDYSLAVLESIKPYPMARFWMHGCHLYVNGQKMSKSKGNIYYTDTLLRKGYTAGEIRFFLMYDHYRERLNYSDRAMTAAAGELRAFKKRVADIRRRAGAARPSGSDMEQELERVFRMHMDNDMRVKDAFDDMQKAVNAIDAETLTPSRASGIIRTLKKIDEVLQVIF
jgi:cysteinyl-tRNA synthetase